MIEVVNIKTAGVPTEPWDMYIGREHKRKGLEASPLANPYKITAQRNREKSVEVYKLRMLLVISRPPILTETSEDKATQEAVMLANTILKELDRLAALYKKHGKLRLFCWCKPEACHGDIIKKYLEGNVNDEDDR